MLGGAATAIPWFTILLGSFLANPDTGAGNKVEVVSKLAETIFPLLTMLWMPGSCSGSNAGGGRSTTEFGLDDREVDSSCLSMVKCMVTTADRLIEYCWLQMNFSMKRNAAEKLLS